jgi:hypothetical protein
LIACPPCSAARAQETRSYTRSISSELDGQDLRGERWDARRAELGERTDGVRLCEHIADADGTVVFRAACTMALEGLVAKRRDSPLSLRALPGLGPDQEHGAPGHRARHADRDLGTGITQMPIVSSLVSQPCE